MRFVVLVVFSVAQTRSPRGFDTHKHSEVFNFFSSATAASHSFAKAHILPSLSHPNSLFVKVPGVGGGSGVGSIEGTFNY